MKICGNIEIQNKIQVVSTCRHLKGPLFAIDSKECNKTMSVSKTCLNLYIVKHVCL